MDTAETSALVIAGSQGRVAFSSGHDLKEVAALQASPGGGEGAEALFSLCSETMVAVAKAKVPTVAVVEGVCSAAGLQLAASCDLLVGGRASSYQTPGVLIGLFCSTPAVALINKVVNTHTH